MTFKAVCERSCISLVPILIFILRRQLLPGQGQSIPEPKAVERWRMAGPSHWRNQGSKKPLKEDVLQGLF
ncbi:hypothetical protein FJ934_19925 [Mesorhizobium sp. B2-4-12]|uniref:hypothetical protein n=1 Tax=unclassified Mesorhizobium TaxID=325217 RepID=UPI0011270981|nr:MULTISPECIES: hypothetical protein [unclassified Mesorhizobium]TPK88724.1 hypothetical protein FJ548_12395 [Mesorhizobium sp. B2-4-17]TPK92909.1 hypothetical protein FJ934_19925 [Mesorhizobium sp. B2-4-12]